MQMLKGILTHVELGQWMLMREVVRTIESQLWLIVTRNVSISRMDGCLLVERVQILSHTDRSRISWIRSMFRALVGGYIIEMGWC